MTGASKKKVKSNNSKAKLKVGGGGPNFCPVDFDLPPKEVPFGSLGVSYDRDGQPILTTPHPKRASFAFPKNPKPRGIEFPFMEPSEEAERILHTDAERAGHAMGKIRVGRQKLIFPGWLVELNDEQLNSIMKIKSILGTGKKICDIVDELVSGVQKLVPGVPKQDVIEVLRRIPLGDKGWSFPHFMFAIGCPKLAREKGVFQDPIPFKTDDCNNSGGDGAKPKPVVLDRAEALQRLVHPYKYDNTVDNWPLSKEQAKHLDERRAFEEATGIHLHHHNESEEIDLTGYSNREKFFFSGLLIFEMYHTIRRVENLYFQSDNIPEPEERVRQHQTRRGFGVDNVGTRKLRFAEWDRPLPPIPTLSPYLQTLPFVATRWKITRPNEAERTRRRTLTVLQPLHLVVNPPPPSKLNGKIKVTENQERIKKAIDYLASIGDCVSKLPFAHVIVHLSDTFLERLEEINIHAMDGDALPPKLKPNNDMAMIKREVKKLLFLHGIPPQISRMKTLIEFSCGICLRKICEHIRQQHWEFVSEKQVAFRNKAWKYMHVERIPCGALRENFVYTFDTYLPYNSHLPVLNTSISPLPI